MNLLRAALLVVGPALAAAAPPAGWAPNLAATAAWNSNATNADRAADVIAALQLRAELTVRPRQVSFGRDDSLVFSVGGTVEAWPRFSGLDRLELGPRLAWRHKFGLGALAPVLSVELAADGVAARESDRAGVAGRARVVWRRRLDEVTQLSLSCEQARHDARAAVFDRSGAEAALEVARDCGENWRMALAARWRDGDVLSYATPPRPDLVALARVRTLVNTFDEPRIAYSLSARTLGGAFSFIRRLDDQTSLALGYEGRTTERGPLRYVNHLVSTAFTRQF